MLTLSWQPASPRSTGRYCRVEGCQTRLMSCEPDRTRGGVRRGVKRGWSAAPYHHCHRRYTEESLKDRRDGRDGRKKTSPSLCHRQGYCPRAGGGCGCVGRSRGSPIVKVNIPDRDRNATSRPAVLCAHRQRETRRSTYYITDLLLPSSAFQFIILELY